MLKTYKPAFCRGFLLLMLLVCCACPGKTMGPGPYPEEESTNMVLVKAEKRFQEGLYKQALELYQDYLAMHPDSQMVPSILLKIGAIHSAAGEYEAARAAYRRMMETYPESGLIPDAKVNVLAAYYQEGRYPEVIEESEALDDGSIPPIILIRKYSLVGDAYLSMAEYGLAFEAFARFYELTDAAGKQQVMKKLKTISRRMSSREMSQLAAKAKDSELYRALLDQMGTRADGWASAEKAVPVLTQTLPKSPWMEEKRAGETGYDQPAIGCLLPLSGKYEVFGAKALRGIELALEKYSRRKNAVSVRIVVKDTEGDVAQTVMGVRELSADPHVAAIIGPLTTAQEAAIEAQKNEIPIITLTQKKDVTQAGEYVFRHFLTPEMQVRALVSYTMSELGLRRFAVLYPDEKYGATFMNLFWDEVAANSGEIVGIESYQVNQTDFSEPIRKLIDPKKRKTASGIDFDAIFIPEGAEKASMILPQLTYYDIVNVYRLGTNLWHNDKLMDSTHPYMQGAIIPEIFFADSQNEKVKQFVEHFETTYSEKPGFLEALAYDTAMMLFRTVSRPGVKSRAAVRDQLLRLADFQGVTGLTGFDKDGDARKQLYLLQVKGQQFIELGHGRSMAPEDDE
ncbi:MAG: penicillin-binding protein activator [Thermodesulfobacteriota bacterium]